jgi:hypothetical protein
MGLMVDTSVFILAERQRRAVDLTLGSTGGRSF